MIQITQRGLSFSEDLQINALESEFAENNCVVLPQLIEENLIGKILKNIEKAAFHENKHFGRGEGSDGGEEFASDETIEGNELALHQIHLLLNGENFLRTIGEITGCADLIKGFVGRIYRSRARTAHHLDWHDDAEDGTRLIGISVNLSGQPFEGGVFQIRSRRTGKIFREVGCLNSGDAHLFRISKNLQHRVTKLEGDATRTMASGWFVSKRGYLLDLKNQNQKAAV
jgi:hypothetical protein